MFKTDQTAIASHAAHGPEQTFDLWVNDAETLNSVMRDIGRIKGVVSVERLRT